MKVDMENKKIFKGALIIFYQKVDGKTLFLVVENAKTGNVSFVGGAQEGDESMENCAKREIKEELNLDANQYGLKVTDLKHEFVFNKKKVERVGCRGSYQIFLAEFLERGKIEYTNELKKIEWMGKEKVLNSLTFPELKELFEQVIKHNKF